MKSDLDQCMEEAGLDAILVAGSADHNSALAYFTGPVHVSVAELVKKRGEPPVLFYVDMERDEAALTGLKTRDRGDYDLPALIREAGGDQVRTRALLYRRMLQDMGVRGRVGVYGKIDIGPAFGAFRLLEELMPEIEIVGESEQKSALRRARLTKDADEVERIRQMGKITAAVVADVAEFLTSHQARDGVLVQRDGNPLTIGEVKRRINLWLAMRGAENPEGTIFAAGHDAGVPHSVGNELDPVPVGKTIIFDIYPCEKLGGYFYDLTRTWCLGYAPEEVQQAYEDVRGAYAVAMQGLRIGAACREVQLAVCSHFEARGHPTVRTDFQSRDGYVHSVGHGLGLDVHESPYFHHFETNTDVVTAGAVVTVEPGLYYPDREYGVRLEDTVWVRPDGQPEVLVDVPTDLVLKVPGV
jgi:Xaa-Pro aminopeptidase